MTAVDRSFRFPLDIELSPTPLLNSESNDILFNYLHGVSTNSVLSLSVLQVLIEERRASYRETHSVDRVQCSLKVGDVL